MQSPKLIRVYWRIPLGILYFSRCWRNMDKDSTEILDKPPNYNQNLTCAMQLIALHITLIVDDKQVNKSGNNRTETFLKS